MAEKPELSNSDLLKELLKIYEPYFLIFPDYYRVYIELINNMIYKDNDSSFSLQYKLFYGLMASSTIGCEYLLLDFEKLFINFGGDKSWIEEGLKCKNIPEQIRGMAIINNILAHKPWVLDWRQFSEFKNGLYSFLFQSAIILTSIQRFASIISSFNSLNIIINKNIENEKNEKDKKSEVKPKIKDIKEEQKFENDKNNKTKEKQNVKDIKEEQKIKEDKDNKNNKDCENNWGVESTKKRKKQKSGEKLIDEIQKAIISVKKSYKKNREKIEEEEEEDIQDQNIDDKKDIIIIKDIFKKYISELIISYNDFNPHIEKYLLVEDFDWKKNAKYFFVDYAGKEMEYLEKDLKVLENLTLETNTDENKINIFKLKNAIEKYLCLIFGISDEEYNYHLTNESLSVELKRVIKKVACYPDHIAELEINSCLEIISKEQLVYLIFIVSSIKQKISLTFFAKAFDDFISNNKSIKNNNIDN